MFTVFAKRVVLSAMIATAVIGCSSDDDDNDMTDITVDDMTDDTTDNTVDDTTDNTGDDTTDNTVDPRAIDGVATLGSARPVVEAISELRLSLMMNDAVLVLPAIDHQANALSVGLELRPTSVQLFGNPALGTPLMQVNQLAGLDLPQKMLAWENEDGVTTLAYNTADYLRQRHTLDGSEAADTALDTIATVLEAQARNASGNTDDSSGPDISASMVSAEEGVVSVISNAEMDDTYDALIASIEANDNLTIVAQIDHQANAEGIGEELDPTRLVIFGNPNAGTPLMQSEQTIGIDLPQKMLVFEDADDVVTVAYNDPVYLAERHGITGQDDRLAAIASLLNTLANNAAGVAVP